MFCQTGWEQRHNPNPNPNKLKKTALSLSRKGEKVAIVTNDGTEKNLVPLMKQEFVSVRLASLKDIWPVNRERIKSVRIGVEGVSERLRSAVRKPFSTEELVDRSKILLSSGVGVRWFFICGLPGETESDYDDLKRAVLEIGELKKGVIMMNFHAFQPQPAAPLGVIPVVDNYWEIFEEFRRWFFHGPGFTRRIQIVAPAQYKTRMKNSMLKMSCSDSEIRRGWFEHDNPNWRIKRLITPDNMRRLASKYMKKLDI